MILKCAQHISLSENSHPPKLIKSYIAISCLIKATLCSENPAQLSNGCYSMKTDCIFLRGGGEDWKQHILSLMACRGLSQPRRAKMERFPSHASMGIFAPAGSLVNKWQQGRSNRRAQGCRYIRIGTDRGDRGLNASSVLAAQWLPVGQRSPTLLTLCTYFGGRPVIDPCGCGHCCPPAPAGMAGIHHTVRSKQSQIQRRLTASSRLQVDSLIIHKKN